MASRDEIVRFCDELLDVAGFEDYGPNGLQVPGRREVETIATGVSAHQELFARALEEGAELVLVHHGLFWDAQPRALSESMAGRLRTLLEAELSLLAYHLPLDAHPELGNNALLCEGLGFTPDSIPFAAVKGRSIGIVGHADPMPVAELVQRTGTLLGRAPLLLGGGPAEIGSIGIVSGGGQSAVREAIGLGLDAFLTGEPAEWAMAEASEGGIHFLAAGHHATETLGIGQLGEVVAERFGLRHGFIEVPNPV